MTRHIFFLLLSLSLAGAARAKPNDDADYTRLARLSYVEGSVSYQHATDVDWAAASINLPLEPGDRIYTSQDGRAEIEFDDGSVYRLARNTDVEILSLKEDLIQLRVLIGLSTLVVSSDTDFEINTPAAAFNTLRKGVYRFNVEENGDSDAIVRKGKLEAANNNFSRRIESGEVLRIAFMNSGNPEFARYERRDDWDEWNDRRNADMNAYGGRKYLPDTVNVGVSDLYRYGRWVDVDTYGSAWVPYSVDDYWSPYSVGRWCYRPIFGWTWVSYEPWGWLPYHYGRWYRSSSYGWCWLPGPAFAFNFWSPGLVAFYSGPGWVSWCPLGPGDYYNAHYYHYNRGIYGHQLDQLLALHTRPQGSLFNRDAPHAFRTAPIDRFRDGSFGGRSRENNWANVDQPWKHGELVQDNLSIRPTPTSYRAAPDRQADRPVNSRGIPAVIRSSPEYNMGGADHFTRITNPQIPSLPSREERVKNAREEADSVRGTRPAARVMQTPRREQTNPSVQNPSEGGSAEQGGRRMQTQRERANPEADAQSGSAPVEQGGRRAQTPRWSRVTGNDGEGSNTGGNATQRTRPDPAPPAARQSTSGGRSETSAPEQRQTPRAPAEPKTDAQERKPERNAEPRSRTNGNGSNDSSSAGTSSESYMPRPSNTFQQPGPASERNDGSRAYSSPRQSSPSSERNESARAYSSPRQASPSFERNDGARSFSAPSYGRSGGNSSPSFGRPSGGGYSGGSSGGSQRSQERGSSGGGRGRR